MDDRAVAHVKQTYRLMQIAVAVVLILYVLFVLIVTLLWDLSLFLMFIVASSVYLLLAVPVVRTESEMRLLTERSPAEVREEIQSVDNPFAVAAYALADEGGVGAHEMGTTYETTHWFGLRTVSIRYETEEQPNGGLLVRPLKNGSESIVNTVSIEPADGTGTLVTAEGEHVDRKSLLSLLQLLVRGIRIAGAFEANGYEVVSEQSRIGLR